MLHHLTLHHAASLHLTPLYTTSKLTHAHRQWTRKQVAGNDTIWASTCNYAALLPSPEIRMLADAVLREHGITFSAIYDDWAVVEVTPSSNMALGGMFPVGNFVGALLRTQNGFGGSGYPGCGEMGNTWVKDFSGSDNKISRYPRSHKFIKEMRDRNAMTNASHFDWQYELTLGEHVKTDHCKGAARDAQSNTKHCSCAPGSTH
jgi:hypothetical protein